MDLVQYAAYRQSGGSEPFARWEFGTVTNWPNAPAPAQVARLAARQLLGGELPDKAAADNITHWGYGTSLDLGYIFAPSQQGADRCPVPGSGLPPGSRAT